MKRRMRNSYFKAPNALIGDSTLSYTTRKVGMVFYAFSNALGGCRKSYKRIAALAGCSESKVFAAVRELSAAGYLSFSATKYYSEQVRRTVYGQNRYTVDLALLKQGYTIFNRAIFAQDLTDSAFILMCTVIVCAGNESRAWPSISELQRKTGAARSTVCAGLRLLKALKSLLVQLCMKKNRAHSKNSYHLCTVAQNNYAPVFPSDATTAGMICQHSFGSLSLRGVVRFLANKVKTQITEVFSYLLKRSSTSLLR